MPYQVPQNIDPNKIFLVNFTDLQGRLDAEFYKPSVADTEKQIRKIATKRLKNFCLYIAGGATPKTDKEDEYYSDENHGIPFLRVQNLQTNGEIKLENIKYVNQQTHNGLLKRSQIFGGDLLIKITGVGRMAIASVVPDGFIGNINQHMVVMKTGDKTISKYLAKYLNLDVIEKIASRHSTGGTRPALDYPSLLNIPVIENIDFSLIEKAHLDEIEKHQQAEALLQSIDDYLLGELGITLPKKTAFYNDYVCCEPEAVYYTVNDTFLDRNNELVQKGQIFITKFSEVTGGRLDPKLYSTEVKELKRAIAHSKYQTKPLSYFVVSDCSGDWGKDESDNVEEDKYTKCLVIRATEFDNTYNLRLDNSRVKYRQINNSKLSKMDIKENDLLIEKSGGSEDQPVGRIAILTNDIIQENTLAYSNFVHKISVEGINPQYLYFYLKTMYNIGITEPMQSQTNGIRNLIMPEYFNQNIAFPSLSKQLEIANHITEIRKQAKQLQDEGAEILRKAKEEVERMILN